MKRTKYKDIIWIVSIGIFIIFVLEGLFYYGSTENDGLRLALNIENAIKAYTVNTEIKLGDAYKFWNEYEGTGFAYAFLSVLTVLYMIAVLIAPFCTVALLLTLAEKTWARICNALSRKKNKRMLVFGKGDNYNAFLKNLSKQCRVTTYLNRSIDDKELVELIKAGIDVHKRYDDNTAHIFETLCKKRKLSRFEGILLCDESGLKNLANYSKLLETVMAEENKKDGGKNTGTEGNTMIGKPVYICAEDEVTAEIIRAYDSLHDNKYFTVNIVNVKECTVNKTLLDHKIHANRSKDDCNVHLGIIGFGDFGQNMLIQGLNMAVLSPDSTIRVDVFDKKMGDILGDFMKKFALEATEQLKPEHITDPFGESLKGYVLKFTGSPFEMDGVVEIHFWETDAKKISFNKLFSECNEKMPFTYFVIATSDNDSISSASLSVMELLTCSPQKKDIPIIVRTKDGLSMDIIKQDDKENKRSQYDFISVDQDSEIFSYDNLTDSAVISDAKRFNCLYGKIYDLIYDKEKTEPGYVPAPGEIKKCIKETDSKEAATDIEAKWNQMLYKRESSIAQSMHQTVKKWLLDKNSCGYSTEKDSDWLEKTEHRRWCIYMITHGYKYAPIVDGVTKDTAKKTHSCIANWEHMDDHKETARTKVYDILPYMIIEQDDKKIL